MSGLISKWGSKQLWLRSLWLRANLIWVFREELLRLELNELRWLGGILKDAYLTAHVQVGRFPTNKQAFDQSVEIVRNNIEQRIEASGADPELGRLLELVREATQCDAIQEIFNKLASETRSIYRMAPRRSVRLQREWLADHPLGASRPGNFRDPYHINARTTVQNQLSLIELQIHLDGFDVASLLALPALLTHELVCHAYANEDRSDQRSIWAEGVMDWAALFFFEKWGLRLGLPYAPIKTHGETFWEQRMTPTRYVGRATAETLVQWLANDALVQVRGLTMARQVAARFALEVNVSAAPLLAKDSLASRIANIGADALLQQAFRDWRAGSSSAAAMLP